MARKKITKAVIPAAGFGTRFLPQTKAMPKEMLPIVDKPVIQYVVEELVEAGIEDIIIVTGYHKRTIEDHFDAPNRELIENLKMGGEKKEPLRKAVEAISEMANFVYVRQKGPYGNGTPLLNVRSIVGDEPFIYTWSDEFIMSDTSKNVYQQAMEAYEKYECSILSCIRADRDEDYGRYGYAGGTEIEPGVIDCNVLIEKPGSRDKAPSALATNTCYTFTPDIFQYLEKAMENMTGGELYWNDAAKLMMKDGKRFIAAEVKGAKYYDTGNKFEYLKTVVEFALKHEELNGEFRKYLKGLKL